MFFHMYIAPGRGRQHIWDKILMTTERPFLFAHMLQVSKSSLPNLILYTFLMILYMHIAPEQGHTTPWGHTFDVNRKTLSLCPFVASLKKKKSDFTHIFILFYTCPRGKGRQILGVKILMSTERPYHFGHLLQVLKKSLWSLILYIFFNVFMHVYSPRPGADNPLVTKFWCQQKAQITLTICCKFQNDLFEFWFYTHFLIILYRD